MENDHAFRDATNEIGPDEPSHDDTVLWCPNCETPNQFGDVCARCIADARIDVNIEFENDATPRWDESACMGSMD